MYFWSIRHRTVIDDEPVGERYESADEAKAWVERELGSGATHSGWRHSGQDDWALTVEGPQGLEHYAIERWQMPEGGTGVADRA